MRGVPSRFRARPDRRLKQAIFREKASLSLFETGLPDLKATGVDTRDIAVPALAKTVPISDDYIPKSGQMDAQSYGEVKHAYVDDNGFNESTFTFYVGCSKRRFVVHADIVAPHSRVLRQFIEGPFREGIERYAELPEVDSADFKRLLAYAYNTSNTTSVSETTAQVPMTQRTSTSRLIKLLLAKEHKKFKRKSCYGQS